MLQSWSYVTIFAFLTAVCLSANKISLTSGGGQSLAKYIRLKKVVLRRQLNNHVKRMWTLKLTNPKAHAMSMLNVAMAICLLINIFEFIAKLPMPLCYWVAVNADPREWVDNAGIINSIPPTWFATSYDPTCLHDSTVFFFNAKHFLSFLSFNHHVDILLCRLTCMCLK